MKPNSTISSVDIKLKGKGFIVYHDDNLIPRVLATPINYCGIEDMGHILYVMAMDIIYKFQCENFTVDNFKDTKFFIKAYHQHFNLQKNPWFPSAHLRKLKKEPDKFFKIFKFTLQEDLQKYTGQTAQILVQDLLKELEKVNI